MTTEEKINELQNEINLLRAKNLKEHLTKYNHFIGKCFKTNNSFYKIKDITANYKGAIDCLCVHFSYGTLDIHYSFHSCFDENTINEELITEEEFYQEMDKCYKLIRNK